MIPQNILSLHAFFASPEKFAAHDLAAFRTKGLKWPCETYAYVCWV